MVRSIGNKISEDKQLQEFVEKVLGFVFDKCTNYPKFAGIDPMCGEDSMILIDDICDDMGITEEEVYWMFEQLGYTRED